MTLAAASNHQKTSLQLLTPQDLIGQHFLHYFHNGWRYIQASVPLPGGRPQWFTEKRYPLEPRNLWSKYLNEEILLGIRPRAYTNYLMMDIDRKGANHPYNDKERYGGILQAGEEIGLCRPLVINSSDSEGLHVYYFLPDQLHSFTLAATMEKALLERGFKLQDGHLELFPNPKPYNFLKPTSFIPHRLPLQQDSFLLDWDLNPISDSIEVFLQQADLSAQNQDMEVLREAMAQAQEWIKKHKYYKRGSKSAEEFRCDLEEIIAQGWTGYHQTNNFLLTLAKHGIIFRHLNGEQLVDYMLEEVLNAPNYTKYCRHQHEIETRVRERAISAENYPYYPYMGIPPREKTYKEHFDKQGNVIRFAKSRERHLKTLDKVTSVIAMLEGEGTYPATAYKRELAIIAKSKEAYNEGVSFSTLRKEEYKLLWHPAFEHLREQARVSAYYIEEKYSKLPDPWDLEMELKAEEAKGLEDLHVHVLHEGLLLLAPAKEIEAAESAIYKKGDEGFETEPSGEGEQGLETPEAQDNATNQPQDQVSLILISLILFQFVVIQINSIVSDSNSLTKEVNSNSSCSNNSNSSNSLIHVIEAEFSLNGLIHKYFQCNEQLPAPAKKSTYPHKQNLLLLHFLEFLAVHTRHIMPQLTDESISVNQQQECNCKNQPDGSYKPQQGVVEAGQVQNPETDAKGVKEASVGSSPSSVEDSSNNDNHNQARLNQAPDDNQGNSTQSGVIPLTFEEAKFKGEALREAKHQLNIFCNMQNIRLMAPMRDGMRQFLQHCLMHRCPHPRLQQEATSWFASNRGLIEQIGTFTAFWEHFADLAY